MLEGCSSESIASLGHSLNATLRYPTAHSLSEGIVTGRYELSSSNSAVGISTRNREVAIVQKALIIIAIWGYILSLVVVASPCIGQKWTPDQESIDRAAKQVVENLRK